eukprot:5383741-Pyramimonas_sp.AAC.1
MLRWPLLLLACARHVRNYDKYQQRTQVSWASSLTVRSMHGTHCSCLCALEFPRSPTRSARTPNACRASMSPQVQRELSTE